MSLHPVSAACLFGLLFDIEVEEGSILFCEALSSLRAALYKSEIFCLCFLLHGVSQVMQLS
jgi:hypothetical protein